MSLQRESLDIGEKQQFSSNPARPASLADHVRGRQFSLDAENQQIIHADQNALHRSLKGRHMQMIAM